MQVNQKHLGKEDDINDGVDESESENEDDDDEDDHADAEEEDDDDAEEEEVGGEKITAQLVQIWAQELQSQWVLCL